MWILACLYCISHNSTKNFTTHLYKSNCLRKFNRPMSNLEILTAFSQPCLVRSRDRVQQMTILDPRQGVPWFGFPDKSGRAICICLVQVSLSALCQLSWVEICYLCSMSSFFLTSLEATSWVSTISGDVRREIDQQEDRPYYYFNSQLVAWDMQRGVRRS